MITIVFKQLIVATLAALLLSTACSAQTPKPTPDTPGFIKADFIEYDAAEEFIYAYDNIQIILDQYWLTARKVVYDIRNDLLWAEGDVRIQDNKKQVVYGTTVFLKDKLKSGVITDFVFKFSDNTLLAAKLAKRISAQQATLTNSCFTPCVIPKNGKPIWQVSAQKTYIDFTNQTITYRNLFFEIYRIPVFYTPYFSHPTPRARAKSGILVPEISHSKLGIPLYIRAKPNLDFTFTPRFARKYNLFELEARHKINNGNYTILGSYGKIPYNIKEHGKNIKSEQINRYHLFTSGAFCHDAYQYGFDLKRTSDKAYLKNYYEMHDSYLASRSYLNNIQDNHYFAVEGLHFYGLKLDDSKKTDPLILPKIRTKNIISLNDHENLRLIVDNNSMIYQQPNGQQLIRSALGLAITDQTITHSGHLFNTNINTRGDAYFVKNMHSANSAAYNLSTTKPHTRYIPELQITWRYPLTSQFTAYALNIEPIISTVIGRNFSPKDYKFMLIDTNRYELSENNLFLSSRYSGIDCHEFGKRISYGIRATALSDGNYANIFLGQLLHKNNSINTENAENVGRVGIDINNAGLFYRFRKNKRIKPIMDEVGANLYNDKTHYTLGFIKLNNLKRYYLINNELLSANNIKQVYSNIEYQITQSWSIGSEIQADISSKKLQILHKSIKVTYFLDCVSITGKIYDDYTSDYSRGITKIRSKTLTLGLKVLNM